MGQRIREGQGQEPEMHQVRASASEEVLMYVIRRKSDGKFFKNPPYSEYCRHFTDSSDWAFTEKVGECLPFKSIAGCRSSRLIGKRYTYSESGRRCVVEYTNLDDYWFLPVETGLVLKIGDPLP